MKKHNTAKWIVHVFGPDDIYEHESEIEALREANKLNQVILEHHRKHENEPHYPFSIALATRLSPDPKNTLGNVEKT